MEAVIKAQLEIEQCSPRQVLPIINDQTWQLYEEKTGRMPKLVNPAVTRPLGLRHRQHRKARGGKFPASLLIRM